MLQDFSWERYAQPDFVPSPSYKCPIVGCRERYIALADLSAHCANVHYTILPACETCGKAFISEMYLKAHMQAKHPRAVTCPKCSKMFTEGGAMAMHQWIAHPGSRCEPCGKYVFQEDMAEHLLTTPGHPVCSQCNIGFVDTGALYDHMALVHPERCCSLCNMIFTTTEHLREHHRTTRRHPSCIHCNVGFSSDTLLIKHNTLMHSSSCSSMTVTSDGEDSDTTTLSSSRASSPRSHIFKLSLTPSSPTTSSSTRIKNSRSLQMVECKVCNIRFSRDRKLLKHYYKSPKHPVCAPCDVGFEDEASYHAHVAKIHPPLYEPPPTPVPESPELLPSDVLYDTETSLTVSPKMGEPRSLSPSPDLAAVDAVTQRSRTPSFSTPPASVAIRIPGSPAAIDVSLSPGPVNSTQNLPSSRVNTPSNTSDGQEDTASTFSGDTAVPNTPSAELMVTMQSQARDQATKTTNVASPPPSAPSMTVPCRICLNPSSDPLVTMCGHVFCHKCIMAEISKNLQCPICKKAMFVRLDLGGNV